MTLRNRRRCDRYLLLASLGLLLVFVRLLFIKRFFTQAIPAVDLKQVFHKITPTSVLFSH
jgi:hypothetical protein